MNEVCIEDCAKARDCRHFEPKQNLALGDMPRFPLYDWHGEMNREERGVSVTIYIAKLDEAVRKLAGELGVEINGRQTLQSFRSRNLSSPFPLAGIRNDRQAGTAPCEAEQTADNHPGNGSEDVDGK